MIDYRLMSGSEGNENVDDSDGVIVELRNKRICVKSKDSVLYLKNLVYYILVFLKDLVKFFFRFLCKYILK